MNDCRLFLLAALASLLAASAGADAPPARGPLAIEDLYRMDHPTSPALAPDGKRLAYVRHWTDAKIRQERRSLWLVEGSPDKARALEAGEPDARAPVFSPDGKWIAFLSTRPRPEGWKQTPPVPPESDPATDIWLIPTAGGPIVPLAGSDKPYGRVFNDGFYGRLAFSPDGRKLAFIADDGKDPRTPEEIAADVLVVRPDQGEGYTGYGPAQVWVAELEEIPAKFAARKIERVTRDDVWYGDPQWARDGGSLVVHANKTADRESVRYSINKNFDLWCIDVRTHQAHPLDQRPGSGSFSAALSRRQATGVPEYPPQGYASRSVQPGRGHAGRGRAAHRDSVRPSRTQGRPAPASGATVSAAGGLLGRPRSSDLLGGHRYRDANGKARSENREG